MGVKIKLDLRNASPGVADSVQEWNREPAYKLQGLHPFEVLPADGEVLPAPHEDRFEVEVDNGAGDSVYYLTNAAPVTLAAPAVRPGSYDGQRLRLSPLTAAVSLPAGSVRGAAATVSIAPGGDLVLLWDAEREVWVLPGGTGSGSGGAPAPVPYVASEDIQVGDVLALDSLGQMVRATATFSLGRWRVAGIATTAALSGGSVLVQTVHGVLATARFAAAPAGAANGRHVFLDDTPGQVTLTPPDIATAGRVRFVVCLLKGADGISTTPPAQYFPQYLSRRP